MKHSSHAIRVDERRLARERVTLPNYNAKSLMKMKFDFIAGELDYIIIFS